MWYINKANKLYNIRIYYHLCESLFYMDIQYTKYIIYTAYTLHILYYIHIHYIWYITYIYTMQNILYTLNILYYCVYCTLAKWFYKPWLQK